MTHTTVDDVPVTTPPNPWAPSADLPLYGRIIRWAEDVSNPWMPTTAHPVDETIRYWHETGVRRPDCTTAADAERAASPEFKEFTANVLRYRKHLLAQAGVPIIGSELDELRRALEQERARHRDDVTALLEALKDEAEDRGWCDEYETFLRQRVEGALHLDVNVADYQRTRNGNATWVERYTVTLHRRVNDTRSDWSDETASLIAHDTESVDGLIRLTLRDAGLDNVSDVAVEYEDMDDVSYEID